MAIALGMGTVASLFVVLILLPALVAVLEDLGVIEGGEPAAAPLRPLPPPEAGSERRSFEVAAR
jgi:hypothetical protein